MNVKELEVKYTSKEEVRMLTVVPVKEIAEETIISAASNIASFAIENLDMGNLPEERFYAIYLDNKGQVLGVVECGRGRVSDTFVNIPKILQGALLLNARSFVAVHNHPSGNVKPSIEDDALTFKLEQAAKLLDIKLLDSVIVSSIDYYTYRGEGALS